MAEPLPINDWIVLPAEDLEVTVARSSGPGGQHVNTTDTRVRLRFALERCAVLSESVKARLREQNRVWLTREGDLVLTSDVHRSRLRNLEDARERLAQAIRKALVPPKTRHATRPTRASGKRRLEAKKRRGDVKGGRGRVRED